MCAGPGESTANEVITPLAAACAIADQRDDGGGLSTMGMHHPIKSRYARSDAER
jgi:hypothetical protein